MAAVIGALRADLSASIARFQTDMALAKQELADFASFADRQGKRIGRIGRQMSTAITLPLTIAGGAVLNVAGDFEQAMNAVSAATLGSAEDMSALTSEARELGATTQYSAVQAAGALEVLAKNGLATEEIISGAADATLLLAMTTGAELAPAADVATDVMRQFNIEASEMEGTVDQIAGTLNRSKFGFEDYAQFIGQAGGSAGALGVEFEDMNAVIAATASLFSSGSDAGTSFKTFLTRLNPESQQARDLIEQLGLEFYDTTGNMRSMGEIAEELRTKLGVLSEADRARAMQVIFGNDAMRTAVGLMTQGAEGMERLNSEIGDVSATEMASRRQQGFNYQLQQLMSALGELAIAIGESGFLDFMTEVVAGATEMVRWLAQLNPEILRFVTIAGGIAAAIGPGAIALGAFAQGIAAITSFAGPALVAMTSMRVGALALTGSLSRLALGFGAAVAAGAFFLDQDGAWQNFWAARGQELGIWRAKMKHGEAETEAALARIEARAAAVAAETERQRAEAEAAAAAAEAEADEAQRELERLLAGLGENTGTGGSIFGDTVTDGADELQQLRDQIYPVEAALREYNAQLEMAVADGIDAADAAEALARQAYQAAGGYEALRDRLDELPASWQALALVDRNNELAEQARGVEILTDRVADLTMGISDLGRGAMTELDREMLIIGRQYDAMRQQIQRLIQDNQALADQSPEAAAQIAILEQQLRDLDAAYGRASASAQAAADAQNAVSDASAGRAAEGIRRQIEDLQNRASGASGMMSEEQSRVLEIERELTDMRMESLEEMARLDQHLQAAREAGDTAEIARLEMLYVLQEELFNLTEETTALQIYAAEEMAAILSDVASTIVEELRSFAYGDDFDLGNLARKLGQQLTDALVFDPLESGLQSVLGSIAGGFGGGGFGGFSFGGFFADGGTLKKGQWGIAGEEGPEPIFAGNRDLTVVPGASGGGVTVVQNITTPDTLGFNSSSRQIARNAKRQFGSA